MNVLLLGANSQLGTDLVPALANHNLTVTARAPVALAKHIAFRQLDLQDTDAVRELVHAVGPDVIINTTAFHRVDDIEKDSGQALIMNARVPHFLALVSRETNSSLVHISTDYVFDGAQNTPYGEDHPVYPLSAYGASKAAGEFLIRASWHKHFIVRSTGLYGLAGASGKGGNFVNTMLKLAEAGKPIRVVADQVCTPTFTADLARQISALIETAGYGTIHITNEGGCSWADFAAEIFAVSRLSPDFGATTSAAFAAPARRPAYSVLANNATRVLGLAPMRSWREALTEYLMLKAGLA